MFIKAVHGSTFEELPPLLVVMLEAEGAVLKLVIKLELVQQFDEEKV